MHESNSSDEGRPECPRVNVPFKAKSNDFSLIECVVVVETPNFVSVGVKHISLSYVIEKLGFFSITTLLDRLIYILLL